MSFGSHSNFRWPGFAKPKQAPSRDLADLNAHDPKDEELTAWCRDMALQLGLTKLADQVTVSWNPRMRTTAGRAWWQPNRIELNQKLQEFPPDETWRTLKHELAHLIAHERAGKRRIQPHGLEWQIACADVGIPGEQTRHSLPLKGRRLKRKHEYLCPVCSATIQRVKPIKNAAACDPCCRKFNSGRYHERFRLIEKKLP